MVGRSGCCLASAMATRAGTAETGDGRGPARPVARGDDDARGELGEGPRQRLDPRRRQDLERAVSELERAVESDPDDAAALYYLGKGIRDLVSKDFLARAENAWREYLLKGAPLGNRDKVEAFLATRKAMSR